MTDISTTGNPLFPPFDYSARDYLGIREDLVNSIPTRLPDWTSRSPSDFGIVLIELFARMGDVLSFYTDRVANEAYLQTAVQRQSVLNIAAMLDYIPRQPVASTAQVTFTVSATADAVTIPAGTKISTRGGSGVDPVVFETDVSLYIPGVAGGANVFTGSVAVTQGETVDNEQIGTSTGAIDQVFNIPLPSIIEGTIAVCVDEGAGAFEWTKFSHLIDAAEEDPAFATTVDGDGVTQVLFGDNVNGRVPSVGAVVTSTYRVGGGVRGNVGPSTITELTSQGGDLVHVVSVNNDAAATGGADAETLDEIRVNAPRALRSLDRAVSLNDYSDLVYRSNPLVYRAKATGTLATSIEVFVVDPSGDPLDADTKADIQTYMDSRKMVGTTIVLSDPTFVDVHLTTTVTVNERHGQTQVNDRVTAAVTELLDLSRVGFGTRVTLSSFYRAINDVEGVEYALIDVLTRTDVVATTNIDVSSPGATIEGHTMVAGEIVQLTAQTDTEENGWWIWNGPSSGMTRRDSGDVVIADGEIPREGTFTITTVGGV